MNELLDLLHEDLNRVKKKPFTESPDYDPKKGDDEMAKLFWKQFIARN